MLRTIAFPNIKLHWHFDKFLSKNSASCLLSNLSNNLDKPEECWMVHSYFLKHLYVCSGIFANADQLGICFCPDSS